MATISPDDASRLVRAIDKTNPRNAKSRFIVSQVTTRELATPVGSILSILSGGSIAPVNLHSGSNRVMMWGVPGFGWSPDPATAPPSQVTVWGG